MPPETSRRWAVIQWLPYPKEDHPMHGRVSRRCSATRGMFNLLRSSAATGNQPWARLYDEGHARHWGPAADYIDHHHQQWLAALLD